MIYAALTQFRIRCNLHIVFRQICTPKVSEFTKTKILSQSGPGEINGRYDYGKRSIIIFFYSFTSSITLSYYSLCQNKSLSTKICTIFIKNFKQKKDFKRPIFAMAFLQTPFSLTDSSFSYCVSHITCHFSGVSIFLEGLVSLELAPFCCF